MHAELRRSGFGFFRRVPESIAIDHATPRPPGSRGLGVAAVSRRILRSGRGVCTLLFLSSTPRKPTVFIARAALAWVDMVCPAAVARPLMLQLTIGPSPSDLKEKKLRRHCRRHPAGVKAGPPQLRRRAHRAPRGMNARGVRHTRRAQEGSACTSSSSCTRRSTESRRFQEETSGAHFVPRGANSTLVRKLGMRLDGQEA